MALVAKDQVGMVTVVSSRVKAVIRIFLTLRDPWHWLADHGVPRKEIDVQSTKFLLDRYKQKSSRSNEQKSNMKDKNMVTAPQSILDLNQFIDLEYFE